MITQRVGVTTTLPGTVPSYLPHSGAGPHEWNYMGRILYHNKQKSEFPDLPHLDGLTPGQTVGLLVTTNGQLHLYLDGQYRKEIATGLPVNKPLWGVADVFGRCTKIKSEILSGESGHYYLCIIIVCYKCLYVCAQINISVQWVASERNVVYDHDRLNKLLSTSESSVAVT